MTILKKALVIAVTATQLLSSHAAEGSLPGLHVEGRHLVTADGERVILHGFAQTYSPWFNERGTKWTNYDVYGCLKYNKGIIDGILQAGWKMTFVRQHMDPYWSNKPGQQVTGEGDISAFDFDRFKKYLNDVFVPMAEYAVGRGLYVVMRPPGVCPQDIRVGDDYQQYLLKVWRHVAQHPKLRDNSCVMFELANEPVRVNGSEDDYQALHDYFQPVADAIREYSQNIILVPGAGWQSHYAGYAEYPIEGGNIGYAVHCYPGWYNGGWGEGDVVVSYSGFRQGWQQQIGPVAAQAPIVVTEMDWAPSKYGASWGKSVTGEAGGQGFGANFRKLCDDTGNVSWLLFTDGNLLADYDDAAPDGDTFLTDPEACPRPCYRWYQYYGSEAYRQLINSPDYDPSAGVRTVDGPQAEVLSRDWFSLDGRRMAGPAQGLCIVRERLSDGKTVYKKVMSDK